MNKEKAQAIVKNYNSKTKHTLTEKKNYFLARQFLKNEALKIN